MNEWIIVRISHGHRAAEFQSGEAVTPQVPSAEVAIGAVRFGNRLLLALIAGPCQMESRAHALEMAAALKEICAKLGIGPVSKTSYDKVNRTSLGGQREFAPMLAQVMRRAQEADIGAVFVATDDVSIADAVQAYGGTAVMTDDHHASGSDRISEAICKIDADDRHDVLVNLQGDLPTILADAIRASLVPVADAEMSIATLVAEIADEADRVALQLIKKVGAPLGDGRHRALYFTFTTAPWGDGPLYHHIDIYAWRRSALGRFVPLPPSYLERWQRQEQLRALKAGMRINAMEMAEVPLSVDTALEMKKARKMFESNVGALA